MTFSFFLSIYSRCGAPASWAARHTIVCLDTVSADCLSGLPTYTYMYTVTKIKITCVNKSKSESTGDKLEGVEMFKSSSGGTSVTSHSLVMASLPSKKTDPFWLSNEFCYNSTAMV